MVQFHNFPFLLFFFSFLDKFVLKSWISRRVSYFVGILSEVGDIFLLGCPQVFSLLNVRFRGISKLHKNLVQRGECSYIYIYIYFNRYNKFSTYYSCSMMITFYQQAKIPIKFWCRWGLNPRSLIQPQ